MDLRLAGRRALVTGSSAGIGKAIASALAAEGARVTICARRAERLRAAEAELRARGGEVRAVAADLATDEGVEAVWRAHCGAFDVEAATDAFERATPRRRAGVVSVAAYFSLFEVVEDPLVRLQRYRSAQRAPRR